MSAGLFAFLDCEIDVDRRELRRAGAKVPLQPKAFDLLVFLIRNRHRVVPREELLEALWPDETVADSSLSFSVKAIRRAVGDDGRSQRVIRTSHGRGFAFAAEIAAVRMPPASTRPSATPDDTRAHVLMHRAEAPLVGRDDELAALRRELDQAVAGETRAVMLVGEAGIGKTRLAAELAATAVERGAEVLVGRCSEGPGPAFWPWVDALRGWVEGRDSTEVRAALGPGIADVARILPELATTTTSAPVADPEQARLRLFDSLSSFLARAAATRPLVVVLDDLHWADASTLLVLRHMVRETSTAPVLLAGAYRDSEVEPGGALAELLGWLRRTRRVNRIAVGALADGAASELARTLLGGEAEEARVRSVREAAEGNPFFVEEFCRSLRRGRLDHSPTIVIPEGVRDLLRRRIDAAGERAAQLLALGAAIGREFDFALLVEASGVSRESVVEALERAVEAGVVCEAESGIGRYAFGHALMRDVAYESVSAVRRAEHHRRIGEALERTAAPKSLLRTATLAHHFAEAAPVGSAEKAIALCEAAATGHLESFGNEEACRWYERALAIGVDRIDEERRFDLLLALARAGRRAGDGPRARDASFAAAEIARARGDAARLALAALGVRTASPQPSAERVALLEEAIAALRTTGSTDRGLLARLVASLASTLYGTDVGAERSIALIEEAIRLARATGDGRTLRSVLRAAQVVFWRPESLDRRLAVGAEHLAASDADNPAETLAARGWFIDALVESGRIRDAFAEIDRHDREAGAARFRVSLGNAASFRAMRAFLEGRLDDAELSAQRAFELSSSSDAAAANATYWAQIYHVRREQRRLPEIQAGIEMFADGALQISWDWLRAHVRCVMDRLEEAASGLRRIADGGFTEGMPPERHIARIGALCALTEVAARTGDADAAAGLVERLTPFAGRWARFGLAGLCVGPVDTALGLAHATRGDRAAALAHFERADAAASDGGATTPLLRCRLETARVLADSKRAPERTRARRLVADVVRRAEAFGLEDVARTGSAIPVRA